ncbi:MAG: GntR family transcriptional regulator, partial [Clostridia bacterium]
AAVNPNTMQRALADLERDGLLFTQRTAGRFITEDANMIEKAKKDLAIEEIRSFLSAMRQIGYTKDDIFKVINQLEGEQ